MELAMKRSSEGIPQKTGNVTAHFETIDLKMHFPVMNDTNWELQFLVFIIQSFIVVVNLHFSIVRTTQERQKDENTDCLGCQEVLGSSSERFLFLCLFPLGFSLGLRT